MVSAAAHDDHIVWLDRHQPGAEREVGGKNAGLAAMAAAGLPVPPAFALTATAYRRACSDRALTADVDELLRSIDPDDPSGARATSARIRERIESAPVPDEVVTDLVEAYEALSRQCGTVDLPVAVRSSATAEDAPEASFAGQHDTFLGVRGPEALVINVRRCWSSLFTERAIAYRRTLGRHHHPVAMSVGVQEMVDPVASGVAFTVDPITGDRSRVAIDASWGLGQAVVSGEVTPDNFAVDTTVWAVVGRRVSDKAIEYVVDDEGTVVRSVIEPDRRTRQSVTDPQLVVVAGLARRAEAHFGHPQDVEWAIDRHRPASANVMLLQSRRETVWSQRRPGLPGAGGRGTPPPTTPRPGYPRRPVMAELQGTAASPGVAEGTARVVLGPDGLGEVQEGEILVAHLTTPSWTPVFPGIRACVTDVGGMMSHAAILCREYGLPAVTGAGSATTEIATGDRIRVDGDKGTVARLGRERGT